MARKNLEVNKMGTEVTNNDENTLKEIPIIKQNEETSDGTTDNTEAKSARESKIYKIFQLFTSKIKETINVELLRKDIEEWILSKIKEGPTIIVGDKIAGFSEEVADLGNKVVSRDSSVTYVSPKVEIGNKEHLAHIDMKPFKLDKFLSSRDQFSNIILFFTLKKLTKEERIEILTHCKRMLFREGQLIVVDEFYPKNVLLFPFVVLLEALKSFHAKIKGRKIITPLRNLEKLTKQLDFKFYDIKYDGNGRIRSHVLTKRWGALIN